MLWLYAALSSAILFAAVAILSKELMQETDSVLFTSIYAFLSTLFYLPVALRNSGLLDIDVLISLLPFILFSGLGGVLAMLSYNFGLKHTDISVAMPLNRLQPLFVALIGAVVLGEALTYAIAAGILLVTLGSYFVLLDNRHHPFEPFKRLRTEKGAQFAVLSAIIFALMTVNDRFLTQSIEPEIYTFLMLGIMTLTLSTYQLKSRKSYFSDVKTQLNNHPWTYMVTGLLSAGAYYSIFIALSLEDASRVVPILQIQIPITVLAGGAVFSERHIVQKLIGSLILFAGLILVIL